MNEIHQPPYELTIIYSPENKASCSDIVRHLEYDINTFETQIDFLSIDQIHAAEFNYSKLAVVVLLVSRPLLDSAELNSHFFKQLANQHAYRNIIVVPVFIDRCSLMGTPFNALPTLTPNLEALKNIPFDQYNVTLRMISKSVRTLLTSNIDRKKLIQAAWEQAAEENSIRAYTDFQNEFPNSFHNQVATSKLEELTETKLWKNAAAHDEIKYYLEYLTSSKRKEHSKDALNKIVEIESAEGTAKKDIDTNNNLSILFDYKLRFRDSGEINKLNNKIYEVLANPYNLSEEKTKITTEANFMEFKICQECSKEEIFSYFLLKKSFDSIYDKLEQHLEYLNNKKRENLGAGVMITIAILAITILIIQMGLLTKMVIFIITSLIILIAALTFSSLFQLGEPIKKTEKAFSKRQQKLVELKMTFIIKNVRSQNKFFLFLFNLEEWVDEMIYNAKMNTKRPVSKKAFSKKTMDALRYLKTERGISPTMK